MEAKKKQKLQKIEDMIGNPFLYRGREVRIQSYAVVEDRVRIINEGNTISFPIERIDEELAEFLPVEDEEPETGVVHQPGEHEKLAVSTFQGDAKRMDNLEDVLMDNIKKLQKGEVDVETSKQINASVSTVLNMSKQKLKMVQEIRKSKKMSNS